MSAKEFVKEHGWSLAIIEANNETVSFGDDISFSLRQDLKTLVDAYELVKDIGGLSKAKEYADSRYTAPEIAEPLKQAIKLVESVGE